MLIISIAELYFYHYLMINDKKLSYNLYNKNTGLCLFIMQTYKIYRKTLK